MTKLRDLLVLLEYTSYPNFALEMELRKLDPAPGYGPQPRRYLTTIEEATGLISRVLPGWWWTCGLCNLSGHASIGPDYNGPHRERLLQEFPPDIFDHGGFDADLAPGDGIHRVCYALMACMVRALIAIEKMKERAA